MYQVNLWFSQSLSNRFCSLVIGTVPALEYIREKEQL